MTTLPIGKSISRSPLRRGLLFIALACFALWPMAQAVSPPPDGGYPYQNTAEGDNALFSLTTGGSNTATGDGALYSNTTGSDNTANGFDALFNNNADNNTASGAAALFSNTTGGSNTANGVSALQNNTTASANTAIGYDALFHNTTGADNTASGSGALFSNNTGGNNTANGVNALFNNTIGAGNTADGDETLFSNQTGIRNTATGQFALYHNTASNNTADGLGSLFSNTSGAGNVASGYNALVNNTTGNNNIAVGATAGMNLTIGSNNIEIGNAGVAGEAAKIRIGTVGTQRATFIAGIRGAIVASGVGVIVGSNGQLGTVVSSERFKDEIKPMDKASEAILALQPVIFRYKHELDSEGIPQFGLVAEQVEKVNPALVARDAEGKVFTVRYEAVNAMLLNEFLKEHRAVQELKSIVAKQEAIIAQQQKGMEAFAARLEKQDSKIQKVSDQIELSKSASQMAGNDR
jgi:hypothetical protein